MFARHGALTKHAHQIEGINSRLDGLQAAVLSVKLKYLEQWTKQRQGHAALYDELLSTVPDVVTPPVAPRRSHSYHLYVIRTEARDDLQSHLREKGVQTGIHYPTSLPFLPAYSYLNPHREEFARALQYQEQILSLPMYAELTAEQIEYVADAIRSFFAG